MADEAVYAWQLGGLTMNWLSGLFAVAMALMLTGDVWFFLWAAKWWRLEKGYHKFVDPKHMPEAWQSTRIGLGGIIVVSGFMLLVTVGLGTGVWWFWE